MKNRKGAYAWTWIVFIIFVIIIAGATYWLWHDIKSNTNSINLSPAELDLLRVSNSNSSIAANNNSNPGKENPENDDDFLLYESLRGYSVTYPSSWKTYQGENSENFYLEWGPPTTEDIAEASDRPGAEIFISYLENDEDLSPKDFAKEFISDIKSEIDIEEMSVTIDGTESFSTRYYDWRWPETQTFIPLRDHILIINVLERDFDSDNEVKKIYNQMISSFKFN